MNEVHDPGGMHRLGRVDVEGNEPVFHNPLERVLQTSDGSEKSLREASEQGS